ncbi:MAG: type IV secretory system conjugative DNA transfer family protein [Planctomycetes bacterium]|nr:type IV secretory system conjugative DNA transfer family protein [Planctomycetota bacterium]
MPISLEFGRHRDSVSLYCRFSHQLRAVIEGQLFAQYPDCKIERVQDDVLSPREGQTVWTAALRLSPDLFPIRRYPQFEDQLNRTSADPLTAILATLSAPKNAPLRCHVEIELRPARPRVRRSRVKVMHRLARPFFRAYQRLAHVYAMLATSHYKTLRITAWLLGRLAARRPHESHHHQLTISPARLHDREDDLQAAADKLGRLLFEASIRLIVCGPPEADEQACRKLREIAGAFGQFSSPRLASFHRSRIRHVPIGRGRRRKLHPFLLSTEELATLWHPATATVRAEKMTTVESREMEPPVNLPTKADHSDLAILGMTAFRRDRRQFGILQDDRRRHIAIVGKTGQGKTTLLQQLIASDIRTGRGVGLIDPHGDLAEALLSAVPKPRTNDVILFDPGDTSHPVSFNVLSCDDPRERPLVASGIVSAFKKLYGDSWGPRLEHILRNALLALLEIPGSTLLAVLRLLSEAQFRRAVTAKLTDPVVRSFWEREFVGMPPRLQSEAIAPIQNKIGHFVSSPLTRNIVGQSRSTINLRRIMDEGKVLIVNLSKGRIGDDASTLLGALLVTSIQIAAMSRSSIPERERRDFYLYVDEFQNFATESFATILSEARKYRLNLTIANQYLAQMDEPTMHAVFGNVGTLLCFQVGAKDAEGLAEQLGGDLTPQDLMRLPRYHAYVRLLIDGHPGRPFSMRTIPPQLSKIDEKRAEIIRRYVRQRYCRPQRVAETEIENAFVRA